MLKALKHVLAVLFLSLPVAGVLQARPCTAQAQAVYETPPSVLSGLSSDELDSFGLRLVTEAYDIRSRIEKPTEKAGGAAAVIGSDEVKAVLRLYDRDALIQRARLAYGLTTKTYVPNYTGPFTVSDVAVSKTSDTVLVISFDVRLPERLSLQSGNIYSGDSMPRILVMRWNEADRMWKIFTHGDFDAPRAVLCGGDRDFMPERSTFRQEDVDLAKALWGEVQTSSLNGTPGDLQSAGFQYVFASGERKTAPGKVRAKLKQREEIVNVEAIRSDDLLSLRFDSVSPMTIDGGEVEKELRPRLVTFHHDVDGKWRMNAIAVFHVTARLAENASCIDP